MKTQTVYLVGVGKAEVREEQVADPSPGQAQVRTVANGICMAEVSAFTGAETRSFPLAVGHEGIGVVTKLGKGTTHLAEGDYVTCGRWTTVMNIDASRAIKFSKPPRDPATFLTEPVCCVVTALYEYDITAGDRVLLMGAGYMGLLNVQGLAHSPIDDLVVSDVKAMNLELARKYGATEVIHAGTPEGQARLKELEKTPFDLVVECAGVEATVRAANALTRRGGRLGIFSWHHSPRTLDIGYWHTHGLKVVNVGPAIATDRNVNPMGRAARLLDRGVFDQTDLITHRHPLSKVQEAMELSAQRPEGFVKGVLLFEE